MVYPCLGLRKKIEAVAKQKECELVGQWQRSIINHLYWCVASTPSGDGELLKAKWLSLERHIHNIHSGHGELYPECAHGELEYRRKWFKRRKNCCKCNIGSHPVPPTVINTCYLTF